MQETPPEKPVFDKLNRNILASNPRVTKFKINWDPTNSTNQVSYNINGMSQQVLHRNFCKENIKSAKLQF